MDLKPLTVEPMARGSKDSALRNGCKSAPEYPDAGREGRGIGT